MLGNKSLLAIQPIDNGTILGSNIHLTYLAELCNMSYFCATSTTQKEAYLRSILQQLIAGFEKWSHANTTADQQEMPTCGILHTEAIAQRIENI